ncbi:MAG: FAD-dependent oxidoreductase [Candidatus Cohnella colombiensis]|uniref:FAD-dependent oxidoreductase n=1 Tax=Candidatus Cohnella colombiensis TaxID=3121368 RepID=A0AA95EV48_9BACL|nr:MAG: FAD-dependent oxidoreductase [Cohnella sp.]
MRLHAGSLYWPSTYSDSELYHYPPLAHETKRTTAVIIGGGMSGITCGYVLANSGIPAIVIDQRTIASGSTSANTGLLQYSNDKMLSEFIPEFGEEKAVKFYRACMQAVEQISIVVDHLPNDVDFKRRSSLYYASNEQDVLSLRQEFDTLHKWGFSVEWWNADQIANKFPFRKAAALVTQGDAEINPFKFVHAMAQTAHFKGLGIYEHTPLLTVESRTGGGFRVITSQGVIEAEHVIYAVGYLPEVARSARIRFVMDRSYAMVTSPLPSLSDWHQRFLLWETARPYLYLRTTVDNRIIVGGLDESHREPVLTEQELHIHAMRLLSELHHLFPSLKPEIQYQWCATFGQSSDGLPWIGEDPDRPGQHFCLGYGGNGSVYSMLGAHLIRDRLCGIDNEIALITRLDRPVSQPASS